MSCVVRSGPACCPSFEGTITLRRDDVHDLPPRHGRVLQELQASQELASVFDKKNQQFIAENQKLQDIIKTREVEILSALVGDLNIG